MGRSPDGRLPNADMGQIKATIAHIREIFYRMGLPSASDEESAQDAVRGTRARMRFWSALSLSRSSRRLDTGLAPYSLSLKIENPQA